MTVRDATFLRCGALACPLNSHPRQDCPVHRRGDPPGAARCGGSPGPLLLRRDRRRIVRARTGSRWPSPMGPKSSMLPRRPRHRRRGRWAGRRRRDFFDPAKSRDGRPVAAPPNSREALGWLGGGQHGADFLSVRGERPSAERFEHGLALAFISIIKRNGRLIARKFNYFASEHLGGGLGNYDTTARPTETTENALSVAVPLSPPSSSRWPRKVAAVLATRLDKIGSHLPALCPGQVFAPVPVLATATH